ncbi:hypothetical protein GDO78_006151 [Eleutherodactylus coqui]|uniref:Uncharacterized protein n=1 Tax=Eleutherodactylus coqui TaxID=57060 RepID=A0A8J6KJ41_ELECQ|nr:hypothetical protein GDO78_006151 [Eleutherodactylus coqui]
MFYLEYHLRAGTYLIDVLYKNCIIFYKATQILAATRLNLSTAPIKLAASWLRRIHIVKNKKSHHLGVGRIMCGWNIDISKGLQYQSKRVIYCRRIGGRL